MASYPYSLTITNPGAETGDTTGWSTEIGGLQALSGGKSGTYRFQHGANPRDASYQDITLDSEVLTDVDADDLQIEISCWIDTYSTPDSRQIAVEFLDTSSNHIGIVHLEWLTTDEGDWTQHDVRSTVPSGTRYVRIWMIGYRNSGSNNDGYYDDWTAQLIDASSAVTFPTYIPVENPSGDEGDASGWTNNTGTLVTSTVRWSRQYSLGWSDIAAAQSEQDVTIDCPALLAKIATGSIKATATIRHIEPSSTDNIKLTLETYDSTPTLLDTANTGANQNTSWTYDSCSITGIDEDSEKFKLTIDAVRTGGTLDCVFDDVSILLEDLSVQKTLGLDALISATGLTKGLGFDASIIDNMIRVTQAGRQVLGFGSGEMRVTQAGRVLLWKSELPRTPSILSVNTSVQGQVTINSSVYDSPEAAAHAATQYQVGTPGGEFSFLIWDSGELGPVETTIWYGPSPETSYIVRVRYQDDEGDWSEWSNAYYFQTPATDGTGSTGDFDMADWAQIWNIQEARYGQNYIGPGGWHKVGSFRGPTSGCSNAGGDAGYTVDPKIKGNVASIGRLMGPPSALVNKAIGANNGANVAAKFQWVSSESGYSWQRFYDVELARAGVVACACGTAVAKNPEYAWNIYAGWQSYQWEVSADFQGVFAYIVPETMWPFYECCCECTCGRCPPECNPTNCWFAGYVSNARLKVVLYDRGQFAKSYDYVIPKDVASRLWPASGREICGNCLPVAAWRCNWWPWIGIRLKFWHDYDADSTGQTHRIQATYLADGQAEAGLPDAAGPWLIDETWVGGEEESSPGAGDGGLKPGWTGYGSDRWTGVVPTRTTGFTTFKDLQVTALDVQHIGSVCGAVPETVDPVDPDPPDSEIGEATPGPQPCPPATEVNEFQELFLGDSLYLNPAAVGTGSIYQFGGYEIEEGNQLTARIHPNAIAPEGYGGECLFKRMVVVLEHFSDIRVSIVPILNGERLDRYAQEEVFIGPGDRLALRRYEVPLYRAYEDPVVEGEDDDRFKYGLRGAYFTFEMTIVDLCGIGLQLPGVWIEYEPLREQQATGIVYTEDLQRAPAFVATGQVFMGAKGYGRLLKAESGTTDDGLEVEARVFSNPIAPAGAAGECLFRRLSLVVKRWNGSAMDMVVTPYLDGEPLGPITINYKATTAPVQEITEVDLNQYYRREGADAIERFRHGLRGAWFHVKVETGSGLQEWLSIDGCDLDYTVVRESLQKDVR